MLRTQPSRPDTRHQAHKTTNSFLLLYICELGFVFYLIWWRIGQRWYWDCPCINTREVYKESILLLSKKVYLFISYKNVVPQRQMIGYKV